MPSNTRKLDIHALVQKSPKSHHLHYTKIRVLVEPTHFADAEQWVNNLMAAAYPGELKVGSFATCLARIASVRPELV